MAMFDEDAVDDVLHDIVGDNDLDGEVDPLDSMLADRLEGNTDDDAFDETDAADEDEVDEDAENEDALDADDAEEEAEAPQTYTAAGRTFNSVEEALAYIETQNQYILSTSKGERETAAPAAPQISPLSEGGDHIAGYQALSNSDRAYIDSTWNKAQEGDYKQLEDLAMRVYSDQGVYDHLGRAMSLYIWDAWADSTPANARKAMQMEMATKMAAMQAIEPTQDPALESVRAEHRAKTTDELVHERLGLAEQESYAALHEWIDAHWNEYDTSNINPQDPQSVADMVEGFYYAMLRDNAASGKAAAPATASKKRRSDKSRATTAVRGEAAPSSNSSDDDDFLASILNADIGKIGLN